MSELYCKFQIHALYTLGGVAETRTVLRSMTDARADVCTDKGQTICPLPLRGERYKKEGKKNNIETVLKEAMVFLRENTCNLKVVNL